MTSVLTVFEWQVTESPGEEKQRADDATGWVTSLLISAQEGLKLDLCAEKSGNHWCFKQGSPKLGFYWIISNEGAETDVSSQLGKKKRQGSEKNYVCCICPWLCYDAFPFHVYLEYAIYFSLHVLFDVLLSWGKVTAPIYVIMK